MKPFFNGDTFLQRYQESAELPVCTKSYLVAIQQNKQKIFMMFSFQFEYMYHVYEDAETCTIAWLFPKTFLKNAAVLGVRNEDTYLSKCP